MSTPRKRPWRIEARRDGKSWVRLLGNYATEANARRAIEQEALGWYFSFDPSAEFRYVNVGAEHAPKEHP